MGRETRDTRDDKAGGAGDGLEDGLDKASEHAAKMSDRALAELFIGANEEAKLVGTPPFRELFVEEKKVYDHRDHAPDPEFLKEIYDSLERKEIHHKKLLEENIPTGRVLRFFYLLRKYTSLSSHQFQEQIVTPANWKLFSLFYGHWWRGIRGRLNNFISLTDLHLRKENRANLFLKWEFFAIFLLLALTIPVAVLFHPKPWSVNQITLGFSFRWSTFIFASSILSSALALFPPFVLINMWFANVNKIHHSKHYHFFVLLCLTASLVFGLLSLFNAGLFHLVDYRWKITDKLPDSLKA